MLSQLKHLFEYDDWANRQTLRSLERATAPPPRALQVMAHIVGCQWLWHGRLKCEPQSAEVWPQLATGQCARQLDELAGAWRDYLASCTAESLFERIAYLNSMGENWESRVQDVLLHVVFHSGYHRGQIAMLLGRAGHESAYTDYIHCIRQRLIDS